ncbi:MAG: formylglycine-generating enzyme family protein, partial [Planctomycetota bacterium]
LRRHRVAASAAGLLLLGTAAAAVVVRSAVREEGIARVLSVAQRHESQGDLPAAERVLQGLLEESGTEVGEAARALEGIRARKEERRNDLVREGDALAARRRSFEAAARYAEALGLGGGEEVKRRHDEALGYYTLEIISDPPGADVWRRTVDEETGAFFPPEPLGRTPIPSVRLWAGWHRLVLRTASGAFGEYSIEVRPEDPLRSFHARIVSPDLSGMRRVEAGLYRIGNSPSPPATATLLADLEEREVATPPFWIDEQEVSNRAYAEFVRSTAHLPPPDWPGGECPPDRLALPVVFVSWRDALAFAEWAGKRLPSEAEWEIACRGKGAFRYPWGNEFDPTRPNLPLLGGEIPAEGVSRVPRAPLLPGGSRPGDRSPWGVLDLAGNVREWVWNPWTPRADADLRTNPGLFRTGERVIRGASFYERPVYDRIHCSRRESRPPHMWTNDLGFRCAKSEDPLADMP